MRLSRVNKILLTYLLNDAELYVRLVDIVILPPYYSQHYAVAACFDTWQVSISVDKSYVMF